MASPHFHIITFGCQMNVSDSQWLARALQARGFVHTADPEGVTGGLVVIINTCSVRDKPEQKVYSTLGRLQPLFDANPEAFAAVGGCVAQQLGEALMTRHPAVRVVFGADGAAMAPQAIARCMQDTALRMRLTDFTETYAERQLHLEEDTPAPPSAFVNIMQGCDNYCAYCIVPYVRGRQKSRPAEAILADCRAWVERGARELTLLGQNVNSYGHDAPGQPAFATLLRMVAAIPGLQRLRFTTSHPKDIAPEVVEAFGELDVLCPQLHLPLQTGSDRMLAAMGRKYDMARYLDVAARLRRARPDIHITTDLMVGFPGETDADFEETLRAMEQVRFAQSFSFIYSDRPNTRAAAMPMKTPREVAGQRLQRLQALQETLTTDALARLVRRELTVLIEGASKKTDARTGEETLRGRDPYGFVVNMPRPATLPAPPPGSLATVRIDAAKKHSLTGELVGEPW